MIRLASNLEPFRSEKSSSGYKEVDLGWDSSKLTHKAGIYVNGHDRHLGMFDTVEEARPSHAIWGRTAPFPRRTVRPEGQDLHAVMLGSVSQILTSAGQSDSDQLKSLDQSKLPHEAPPRLQDTPMDQNGLQHATKHASTRSCLFLAH